MTPFTLTTALIAGSWVVLTFAWMIADWRVRG